MRSRISAVSAVLRNGSSAPLLTLTTIQMTNNIFQAHRPFSDAGSLTSSTNESLIEEYINWKKSYTKTAFRIYRLWVERFQAFVNRTPEDLQHGDYAAFANSIRSEYAPRCVQFGLTIVRNYLRFFAEQGRLRFPLYLIRVPLGAANSHKPITQEEYEKVVAVLKSSKGSSLRNRAIVMLFRDTGIRLGELLSIKIADIEDERSTVIKTEKSIRNRRIFWSAETEEVLRRYVAERRRSGANPSDALFSATWSRQGRAMTRRAVECIIENALRSAGIERHLTPHSFRHEFIHRLARLGVPDAIIAQLVGHNSPSSIAHYTKLSRPEFQEYALRQLSSVGA